MKTKPVKVTTNVKMICSICKQLPKNSQEVLEINGFGYHLGCDHMLLELAEGCGGLSNNDY